MMDEQVTRGRARELAQARYRLRWHILTYVLVNVGLLFFWWNTGMGYFWPVFPIVGWGIGVFLHYRDAYRSGGSTTWIDRETEKVLQEVD